MSISATADAVIATLKSKLPPLLKPENIGLCLPDSADKFLLGVHIYAITRDLNVPQGGKSRIDSSLLVRQPFIAELRIIVTSYVGKKSGPADDYRLLERVVQIWHDDSEVKMHSPIQPSFIQLPRMELLNLDADEISRIWQFTDAPYTLSLFYKLAPVAIQSQTQITAAPVGSAQFAGDDI